MKLSPIELNAVLAGLRLLQQHVLNDSLPLWAEQIAGDSGDVLEADGIDDLCERINQ